MSSLALVPITKKVLLDAIITIALINGSVVAADAADVFSDIKKDKINDDGKKALNSLQIKTGEKIPTGKIPHGFGAITDVNATGVTAVSAVITIYPGVYDGEDQADANDPVWHNHVLALRRCGCF